MQIYIDGRLVERFDDENGVHYLIDNTKVTVEQAEYFLRLAELKTRETIASSLFDIAQSLRKIAVAPTSAGEFSGLGSLG